MENNGSKKQKKKREYIKQPSRKMIKYIENHLIKGQSRGKAAINAGYSKYTARTPKANIESTKTFKALLAKYSEEPILDRWYNWALNSKDKRVAVDVGKELLKLKDRYPSSKLKLGQLGGLQDIIEEE